MKNLKYRYLGLFAVLMIIVGCEEDPIIYTGNDAVAAFNSTSSTFPVSDQGEPVHMIEVGVTTKSSSDRTFSVAVVEEESTVDPGAYEISDLVIPAGEFIGTVNVEGVFENLAEEGTRELVLELTDLSSGRVADYRTKHTVTMFRFCPFPEGADFLGDYQLTVLEPGQFDVNTVAEGVVTLTEGPTVAARTFNVAAYPDLGSFTPFSFRFSLVCGKILVQQRNMNVGCGGTNAVGPSSTRESTFDINDDSELIIYYVDDVRGQCDPPVETALKLTKV